MCGAGPATCLSAAILANLATRFSVKAPYPAQSAAACSMLNVFDPTTPLPVTGSRVKDSRVKTQWSRPRNLEGSTCLLELETGVLEVSLH
ncbi:hypothetical protein E4U35_003930 [Claviceps purpurea]|nr:hypothetical protein E4U35_003930 [Claviceps purpurea]